MKKITLFTAALLLTLNSFAQAPSWVWAKSSGGTSYDSGNSVATDANGNIYVVGSFDSYSITFGTIILTNAGGAGGNADIFVVKYDINGNVLWAKSAGGSGYDVANSITVDTLGNVIILGDFSSSTITFGGITLANAGSSTTDIFIVKYNTNGNVIWAKSAGGTSADNSSNVATDVAGNIYITGYFYSPTITFGTTTLTNAGSGTSDIFIVKYDTNGNIIWAKRVVGISQDIPSSVTTDALGNILIAGQFSSSTITFGGITLSNAGAGGGYSSAFIVKYDASGTALWAKSAGGSNGNSGASSIIVDISGNIYVGGAFNSSSITFGTTTLINAGGNDIFIVKYNANGAVLRAEREGGSGYEGASSLSTDASGNIFVAGVFTSSSISFGANNLINTGGSNIFIVKYDSTGIAKWAKSSDGNCDLYSLKVDATCNIYITGSFDSDTLNFASSRLINTGSADVFLSKLSNISYSTYISNVSCFGGQDGSASIIACGGQGVYSYNWYPYGGIGLTANNLAPGIYTVTITDTIGNNTSATVNISEPPALNFTYSQINNSCYGGNNGSINIITTGGSGAKQYSKDGGSNYQTSNVFNGLIAGIYQIVVKDANNCVTSSQSVIITQPALLTFTYASVNANCMANGGNITITANGGTGTILYSYNGGNSYQSSNIFSGLGASTYQLKIIDANGCISTIQTVIITRPTAFLSFSHISANVTCFGGANGNIIVTASGGTGNKQYSKDGGNNYQISNIFSGLIAGTYSIVVRDTNNCSTAPQSVIITQPTLLAFSYTKINIPCFGSNTGSNTGSISVTASGGTGTKQYSNDGGVTYQSSNVFNGLIAGSYQLMIKDANNCVSSPQTVLITQPTSLPTFTDTSINVNCYGGNTGSITVTGTGGTGTYQYSKNGGTTYQASNVFNGLIAGTYNIMVKDSNSCTTAGQNVIITQSPAIVVTPSHTNFTCVGTNDGTATVAVTGGTGSYTYHWLPIGGTNPTATGLTSGTFTCTVTDSLGCIKTQSFTITAPTAITFSCIANNVTTCHGDNTGSITVTASGGTAPLFYSKDGGVTYQSSNIISGLTAGTYQIMVKDANNCISSTLPQSVTITQPQLLTSNYSSVNVNCYGSNTGSITITASGGTGTYQYSKDGGSTYQLSNSFTGLAAGTYQIVVKDAHNCISSSYYVIIDQPNSILNFTYTTVNNICNAGNTGSITITANGGWGIYQYSINGGGSFQSSNVFTGLTAGTYSIVVMDNYGCYTTVQNVTITQPTAITTSFIHNNGCFGNNNGSATITASGGTGVLTYNWLPYGGTVATANNLTSGTYTVTVTDSNSCTTSANVTITQPSSALSIYNTNIVNTQCGTPTGQITANVNGGTLPYHYMWSNGDTTAITQNLPAGNYTLTVTDGNGCTATTPTLTVGTTHPNFGIAFTAIATTGAAPFFAGFTNATPNMSSYNFTWFWGDATSTASNNTNITHTYSFGGFYDVSLVAVNTTNGCADTLKKTGYIFVTGTGCTQTAILSPSVPFNGCTGDTLVLTASTNAASGYTYQWNVNSTLIGGATSSTLLVTQTGNYSATVLQAGCPVTSTVVQVSMNTNPQTPQITTTGTIVACVGGSVTLTASPLSGGNYLWNTSATTQSITVITPGVYTVTENYGSSVCSSTSAPFYLGTSLPVVPLCMVSVDSLSTHNIVIWEKTGVSASVDSFRIYREVMTNVYSNIASVSNDSLSEYHDYGANPNVTSFKYKLVALDTCGSISGMSDFHNTIHLQYLGNGNLQWTLYDIENAGNPVNFYIINRDDTGTGNFLPISSTIPGGNSTYTDVNYTSFPNARYRVDVNWSISCTPTRAISTTHSNIIHLGTNSVSQLEMANSVTIYPNPFTSQTTITFSEIQKNTTIKIMDVVGKEIRNLELGIRNSKTVTLDMSGYAKGVYFVQITTSAGSANEKVVNKKIVVQ